MPQGRRVLLPSVLLATAAAVWLVEPVVGSRPPAGEDVMAHLVRADFGIAELVAHGRLDGWFPRFVLGHQEFLFNGPGLVWLMALVRTVTLGAVSNAGALKVVAAASFVAFPAAVAFLARSFRLSPAASGLAAVLGLLVSSPFGVGLRGLFETGLVPHQVGAVLFCLALGSALRVVHDDRRRWVALLAFSLAALAVTHLISLLILGVIGGLVISGLAAAHRLHRPAVVRLLVGGAAGAGLCGFWLVPFLAHRDLQGTVTTWKTPPVLDRLGAIVSGDVLYPAGFALAVLAAWGFQLRRSRRLLLVAVPAAYLVLAHGLLHLVGRNGATLQLPNRGLGYVGVLGVLSVAAVLADVIPPARYGALLAVLVVASVVSVPGRENAGQFSEPVPALPAAARELARLVPDGARFAVERDYPAEVRRTGVVHPETWLARASGRNSLNGFNLESSSTPNAAFLMDRLEGLSATRIALRLSRYGVTHVVATSAAFTERLTRSPRFVRVWSSPPVTILALQPAPAQITSPRPVAARLVAAEPEHLVFEVDTGERSDVTVALAWSPKWHGRIGGAPVRLTATRDGLVGLTVPPGRSELRLDYRGDAWDRLGVGSTVLTGVAGGVALVRTGRRRRRSAAAPNDS